MPTPVLSGQATVASGSLATLDRYSAYGVTEPNVLINDINPTTADSAFTWDYTDIAVQPTAFVVEMSGNRTMYTYFEGSNDGTNWTTLTGGAVSFDGSTVDITRLTAPITTDKFYRYLRYRILNGSYFDGWTLYVMRYEYSLSRPWSSDGNGGVGPGGGDGPPDGEGGGANDPGGENDPSTHEGFSMSDLSVYLGDMVLGWIKGTDMASAPADVYVALFDGDPDDTGSPGAELTGTGGLTRAEATFGSIVARYMLNTNKLEFGAPSSDVTVACICLYDASTGGNRLTRKMLAVPGVFTSGTPIIIQPGKLPVYY